MNRLSLFPESTIVKNDTLTIAGHDLAALAGEFGTPLYLYDRYTMDQAVARYQLNLTAHYPGPASITYAGKAFLCTAMTQWTHLHQLWLDCTGEGEIAIAQAGGIPRERLVVHGVSKSIADIHAAIRHAGTVVVDNQAELIQLVEQSQTTGYRLPNLWLRLQPGLTVDTHRYTQTGQHGSKFGMEGEELLSAAETCRKYGLPLQGVHFHLGSQFHDPAPLGPAIDMTLSLVRQIGFHDGWHFSPGGGWGVAYHENELPSPDLENYIHLISEHIRQGCRSNDLPLPHLHLEPGRSLVAQAGVALYRVNTVKRDGSHTWLLVDGGLADNPRYALYKTKYSCLPVAGLNRKMGERVHIAGPYCESGDILIDNLQMPRIEQGELIAIPVSGAYQLSMSSNYNGALRPAVLWLEEGRSRLIQRRQTIDDLLSRDLDLSG